MTIRRRARIGAIACAVVSAAALSAMPARAAGLPDATRKMLSDLKLDPSILKGIDEELKVPKAWIDGAKKAR